MRAALFFAIAVTAMSFGAIVHAQLTLEIPETEFEEIENYKPIPVPDPSGGPVNQMFEYMELDMTGTLPEAVLGEMLGETPYDFVDVVWGMEVTGDWTDQMTGEGTLQVTDFTEGLGATLRPDPERFTGDMGFRMYNARLQTDGDHVFTLSAAFPPDQGGIALGTELDAVKALFEVTWLCHMFEPGRRGCIDYPDEYYETELPELSRLHIIRRADSYKIEFAARVRETRTHRDRGYSSTDPTGRVADVRGWVCDRATWEQDPDDCAASEPLQVMENTPPDQRENVHLQEPRIEMEFNYPIDAEELEENFSLTTRDVDGDPLEMKGQVLDLSDTRFLFEPDDDLESGVIYEARIEGSEDGLEGRGGEILESGAHWWRFSTLVDLENHGGPVEEPVRSNVYQTVRDAPLVVNKPALQRIYVDWQPHDHIEKAWQPETFPAELKINVLDQSQWRIDPQAGGSVEGNVVRVVRSDLLEQYGIRREIERQARNTINVYGWTPDRLGGTSTIETQLTPHDPYPLSAVVKDVISEKEVEHWDFNPQPLVFRYALLEVGSWSDGVPEIDRNITMDVIGQAEEFAVQVMPYREAHGIDAMRDTDRDYVNYYRDNVTIAKELLNIVLDGEKLDNSIKKQALKNTLRKMREDISAVLQPDEILVVFYPTDYFGVGRNFDFLWGEDVYRGVGMGITRYAFVSELAMGLVHEFGHHLGLVHQPGHRSEVTIPPAAFRDLSMEGFRIAAGGMSGWNKSATEGNGEHPTVLVPLMWPGTLPSGVVFVNERDYLTLMTTIEGR